MITRLRPRVHERVLPFFDVYRSQDEIERCSNTFLEAVVQTYYLTKTVVIPVGGGFLSLGLFLAVCFAQPLFERIHRQFETIFDFELAVD
jgi:hypothetical protein